MFAHLPELKASDLQSAPPVRQRRTLLPILLFLATCLSTFWVGCTEWEPTHYRYIGSYEAMARTLATNWWTGMQYMVAVLAILLMWATRRL